MLSSQKDEAITVPPMLSHKMLAYNDIGAMPFRRWATSGPQLSRSTASSYEFLIRTVYPGHGYSCSKRGHLWTLVKNGNEMTEYRLLQIRNYVATPKKSNKRGQIIQTNHRPQKKTKYDEANNHLSSGISQASTFHVSSDKFVTSDNKQYSVRSSACLQIQHSMSNIINEIIVDAIIKETTDSADGTESSNSKRVSPPFSALTAIAESDNAPSQKLATSTNKNLAQYEKNDEPSPSTQTSKEAEDTQQKRITVLEDFKERIGGIYNQIIVLPENLKQINAIKYNQIVILHENAKQKMLGIYNQLTIPDDFKDGISIICNEIIALTENTKQRIFEIYNQIINYPIPPNNWTLHNNQFNMFALLLILSLIGVRIFISTLVLTYVMVAAAVCASAAFAKIKMLERDLQILKEFHSKQLRELEECHNAETELCEKEHMEFVSNMITEHREEVDSLKNLMDVYIEASCDTLVMASQGFGRASGSSRRDL